MCGDAGGEYGEAFAISQGRGGRRGGWVDDGEAVVLGGVLWPDGCSNAYSTAGGIWCLNGEELRMWIVL